MAKGDQAQGKKRCASQLAVHSQQLSENGRIGCDAARLFLRRKAAHAQERRQNSVGDGCPKIRKVLEYVSCFKIEALKQRTSGEGANVKNSAMMKQVKKAVDGCQSSRCCLLCYKKSLSKLRSLGSVCLRV